MPRMPFIGVRISWLIEARKRDLAWFASSASSRASLRAASAARCSVTSRPSDCTSLIAPPSALISISSQANQRGPLAVSTSWI